MDYRALALETARAEFVRRYACFFLVGVETLNAPRRRASTHVFEVLDAPATTHRGLEVPRSLRGEPTLLPDERDRDEVTPVEPIDPMRPAEPTLLVLAVKKKQPGDPARVTVGRTSASDVVIPDAEVSRAHAVFEVHGDYIKLADLGSANGTMINGKLLEPNGAAQMVVPGDRLRFALLEFDFLDAESAWDRIHHLG